MKTSGKDTFVLSTSGLTGRHLFLAVTLVLFALVFSGSTLISYPALQKDQVPGNKKLDILEKLESGISISSEEIRSAFTDNDFYGFPEISDLPDIPDLPEMPQFPEFSFNFQHSDQMDIDKVISDEDLKVFKETIARNIEELKTNLDAFRNSSEYMEFRDEMRKYSEELREEMDRLRDEYRDAAREQRSGHIL